MGTETSNKKPPLQSRTFWADFRHGYNEKRNYFNWLDNAIDQHGASGQEKEQKDTIRFFSFCFFILGTFLTFCTVLGLHTILGFQKQSQETKPELPVAIIDPQTKQKPKEKEIFIDACFGSLIGGVVLSSAYSMHYIPSAVAGISYAAKRRRERKLER